VEGMGDTGDDIPNDREEDIRNDTEHHPESDIRDNTEEIIPSLIESLTEGVFLSLTNTTIASDIIWLYYRIINFWVNSLFSAFIFKI